MNNSKKKATKKASTRLTSVPTHSRLVAAPDRPCPPEQPQPHGDGAGPASPSAFLASQPRRAGVQLGGVTSRRREPP
jgi:hypothetical protein